MLALARASRGGGRWRACAWCRPRPISSSPRSAAGRAGRSRSRMTSRNARSSCRVGGSWRRNWCVVRTAPRGRLAIETMRPPRTRLSCRLAPPRSATSASPKDRLARAAATPSRASSRALRMRTSMPSLRRSGSRRRSRLRASRTAEVAMASDAGPLAPLRRVAREEAVDGTNGLLDRARRQGAGGPAAQARRHPLLDQDVVAGARPDARDDEADRGRAQVHDREQIRARPTVRRPA